MPEQFAVKAAGEIEMLLKVADDRILEIIQRHYDAASRCLHCDGLGSVSRAKYQACHMCSGKGKVVPHEAADEIEYLRQRCEQIDNEYRESKLQAGVRSRKDDWG